MRSKIRIMMRMLTAVLVLAVTGCGESSGDDNDFRMLQLGDQWTFTQTTTVLSNANEAVAAIVHEHTVTVVENPTDGSGTVHEGLAFRSDYTQISGPPSPVGTEYEAFSQDANTRDVMLVGNVTPSGEFLGKTGRIDLGSYRLGKTYEYLGEINDDLISFQGTVVGRENVDAMDQSFGCWVVDIVESDETEGQNFHDNRIQTTRINPELGSCVQAEIKFDIGAPFSGRLRVESIMTATNVVL